MVYAALSDEEVSLCKAVYYRGVMRVCQRIARRLGEVGINSEIAYNHIVEMNRTV